LTGLLACLTVCAGVARGAQTTLVVAADETGQYRTVQDAINAAPQTTTPDSPAVIRIKPGTYKELIYVQNANLAGPNG
jgi:pectinesterase